MSDHAVRFAGLADEYESRKRAATGLVERWDWYTWPGLDPRPLHFERELLRPGRRLGDRPPAGRDVLRIGFDADGRAVVVEEYSGFLHGRLCYETFLHHDGAVAESAHFGRSGPIYLDEYRYEDGLMRSSESVARSGSGREIYTWSAGRITRVEIEHDGRPRSVLTAEHGDGGLVRLVETFSARSVVRYERPPSDFDLAAACRAVEEMYVRSIPAAAAGLAADGPLDCLALAYHRPATLFVDLHAATAGERTDLRSMDVQAPWTPAEFEAVADVEPGDPALLRLVAQELTLLDAEDRYAAAGSEAGRRLLCAVAARLNRHDWAGTLPVTGDFVVYAVDLELADLDRNLADCLPPDRVTRLREEGLL